MLVKQPPTYLLASPEPALLAAMEPVLAALGAHAEIVLSAEAALSSMNAPKPPSVAILDANLPGMKTGQLLAAIRAGIGSFLPIVVISDAVTQEWIDRLSEGAIDELLARAAGPEWWKIRLEKAVHAHCLRRELEVLRETSFANSQTDRLTGVYNRETILSMLFRETDRVQRMKGSLCVLLFDIDDFGHWNSRLGSDACDELLCQVVSRTTRLLRTYDLLGRPGMDEFLVALPGCSSENAVMLAERLRMDVFATPFHVAGEAIRLSACFGIATSNGRSPVVVLRDAEMALESAKEAGPETIECFGNSQRPAAAPVTFLSPSSGDELLAW